MPSDALLRSQCFGSVSHCAYCFLLQRIKLAPEQAIFLFVSTGTLPPSNTALQAVYDKYKDEDGFLYMTYRCVTTCTFTFTSQSVMILLLDQRNLEGTVRSGLCRDSGICFSHSGENTFGNNSLAVQL